MPQDGLMIAQDRPSMISGLLGIAQGVPKPERSLARTQVVLKGTVALPGLFLEVPVPLTLAWSSFFIQRPDSEQRGGVWEGSARGALTGVHLAGVHPGSIRGPSGIHPGSIWVHLGSIWIFALRGFYVLLKHS